MTMAARCGNWPGVACHPPTIFGAIIGSGAPSEIQKYPLVTITLI
jgi:hypothetical protein